MLNRDYLDILQALVDEKVKFLLVGAYALSAHGYVRATLDIDIWIMPSPENAESVLRNYEGLNYRQLALLSHALRKPDASFTVSSHRTSHRVAYATARADLG